MHVRPHPRFQQVYQVTLDDGAQRLATRNLTPGRSVYGEKLVRYEGVEYRIWDAFRSKLAAAIIKDINVVPVKLNNHVLYLGAASGTTASHVSDIVGEKGTVYCVEFASRAIRELVNNVCAYRLNMIPILEDARFPEKYSMFIRGKVDVIYCDIAQPEQAKILADNADFYLKESGWIMLAVKAQSIDVTKEPTEVYKQEVKVLESRGFKILDVVHLEPYDKAHAMIVART
ncbi:MAG: fibrillarin-like rRNA/tRNA 2'-O-methyltransferase [Candidatus Bathyarchaeota archaeon]|nr:fibrillarin-like rRNA/tRNA 2'-O-methyltransferase [Candidatus Bathyarchaeota archaeon]MCX8176990.1 fibrillarin-like rRNA/tRNA 2'-O-methyltransferase [Candidatus Bathyarchaeota archaeon]MDW8194388.1 fibrillarin-like rRNA/tRNA 2'-O-methyltransferase [Nitrososphaerota archaeon]